MTNPCQPLRLALIILAISSAAAKAQANDLPLRPGDRLSIRIWSDTAFGDTVRIGDNTLAVLPRVGVVSLAGVPATAVGDSVRQAYARFFRALAVEIVPLRRVTVVGDVRLPNVYFLELGSTVRDAVAIAGGVTDIGKTNRVNVVRDSTVLHLKNWQRLSANAAVLQSGDVVVAEREPWLKRNLFNVVSTAGILVSIGLSIAAR